MDKLNELAVFMAKKHLKQDVELSFDKLTDDEVFEVKKKVYGAYLSGFKDGYDFCSIMMASKNN